MHAVAEFMRQHHDIPFPALVIQKNVRMHIDDGWMGESPGGLPRPGSHIDPAVFEKKVSQRR